MNIYVLKDREELGYTAGRKAAFFIREAIREKGRANIILATGSSQFETLSQLVEEKDIDWQKVVMFHLDEYIGLPASHKASFRKYLKERFLDKVPVLKSAYLINGESNPHEICDQLSEILRENPIDVAMVGIGENGHLAFNDPPADFKTKTPYLVVDLDEACKLQQVNEGWFPSVSEVPKQAISMSVHQIMCSQNIICAVPDIRKAAAVKNSLEKEVNPATPASILQNHPNCYFYLDRQSASLLT